MDTKKTIGVSGLILLGIVLAFTAPQFFEDDKYFCEERPHLGYVACDSFAKYVSTEGKCVRDGNSNLICRDGWKKIVNDLDFDEEDTVTEYDYQPAKGTVICTVDGCKPI